MAIPEQLSGSGDVVRESVLAHPGNISRVSGVGISTASRVVFTTSRQFRAGRSMIEPTTAFLAAPVLDHDTIAVVPWERQAVFAGKVGTAVSAEAIQKLRTVFDSIAARWASAFPSSADAKEALALSLEVQGEPAALDTMAAAERLAPDGPQKIQFATARIFLQLKFGIHGDLRQIERARVSADSLLPALRESFDAGN